MPNNVYGYGRLDVYAAYQKAEIDSPPALATSNVQVAEGTGAETPVTFVVTLARPSTRTVIVAYATRNGTAKAPADFRAATGTLSFAPGERSKSVTVTVIGDAAPEADESFALALFAPSNASLADTDGDRDDHERRRRRPDRAADHAASRQRARPELHALGARRDNGAAVDAVAASCRRSRGRSEPARTRSDSRRSRLRATSPRSPRATRRATSDARHSLFASPSGSAQRATRRARSSCRRCSSFR